METIAGNGKSLYMTDNGVWKQWTRVEVQEYQAHVEDSRERRNIPVDAGVWLERFRRDPDAKEVPP